ncbi:MAG: OB-fold nucleic acid binding domain-containing protein, partial [Pseudomonadales bacterium]|nr:OB-fold nucleic acid binding domain-containing protein [Pseudomonadales bacterium]
ASADALHAIAGNRHQAHWQTAAIQPFNAMLSKNESTSDHLHTPKPSLEKNVMDDYASTGLTLRNHPMAMLRKEYPFNRCKRHCDLIHLNHGRFVRVAGLVTGRQRPGTAKGTLFLTLEDETGNINVVVWKDTQNHFRQELLTAKLLVVKGVVEISRNANQPEYTVIHVVAGQLLDYSQRLEHFELRSRDFH